MWDLIVSVPDHCLSFYFTYIFSSLLFPFINCNVIFFYKDSFLLESDPAAIRED